PLVSRPRRWTLRHLRAGVRAILTQGVLSSYRRAYWTFLAEVWRWDRARIAEALLRAAAGHHFVEYTRRDAGPRLSERLAAERPLPAAGYETASSAAATQRNANVSPSTA